MDDSDQDFVDLCSKLLKRVRKKPGEPRQPRKAEHQLSSQANEGDKKRRNNKKDGDSGSKVTGTQAVGAGTERLVVNEGTGHGSGDAGSSIVPSSAAGPRPERDLTAKDKVLHRMQQFKRASPQRMVLTDKSRPTNNCGALPQPQMQENPESFSSGLHLEPQDSDKALALRLQQELDRESAETQTVDLVDGGLFFCQICQKDLSHMTPAGRTQHLNRCLDESEESAAAPRPPPPPGVPECPICGKKFKSQKSRSAHLKRCSSDMGISPAVLLQALQRQAEETQKVSTADTLAQTGGTKRKGASKPGLPARKKPKKKTEPLDEDTLVALALSSSLLEQEKEQQRDREAEIQLQAETTVFHTSVTRVLKWRPDLGKGCGKKKKGTIPRPPPLLLVQDAQEALTSLQERVSDLLLCSRPHSPPTPTRCPSCLPGWTGAAPLWQKSALLDRGSTCLSDWYTPELRQFIIPWESTKTDAASSNTSNKPDSSLQPVNEGTPATETRASILPSSSQTASCSSAPSTPGLRQHTVGSQTLQDLMELAEDGMTLTQCGYTAAEPNKDLCLSGYVLEDAEQQAALCVSGFLPDKSHQSGAVKDQDSHQSAALSRLATDLCSMVNNPQLSDLQLQVDSGDVYFAHSFMVYARCPLLAEMVYESGFGVQEEGMRGQRVLMSDIPGQAVFVLLQYLYTGHCSIPASLRLHVLELASRFDLQELQQLCELQQDEADYTSQEQDVSNQTDQAFMELLRSMWNEEDEGEEETDTDGGKDEERALEEDHRGDDVASGDREISEEKVNEEELDEIYEFAATQRNRVGENGIEEEEVDEEEDQEDVFANLAESKRGSSEKSPKLKYQLELDPSLDRSYSRLFSGSWGVYEEGDLPSTSGLSRTHPPRSIHKKSYELSGRTLLQSSASVVDDFFSSPPPSTSNLPVPGVSPGQVGDCGSGGDKRKNAVELNECLPLKRESQGPSSICDLPQNTKKKEPELIVLSDSSEEMEVVLSSRSPSPHSPCTAQNPQSYTQLKSLQIPKPNKSTFNNKEPTSLELGSRDQVDCSPEVSWLIPSTPVQSGRSRRTSSSQTKSSMCRTRLFPKDEASSPSSVFSSPALSANRLQTSNSPNSVSTHDGPTEGSVSRVKLDKMVSHSINLDLTFSPKKTGSYNTSKDREVFAVPLSQCKVSHLSSSLHAPSKQDTPLHVQPQPYSSTPLHTDLHQAPGHLATTPLHTDPDIKTDGGRERAASESPEKTELGSFHLSSLSDPLDQPYSFSRRGLQGSQRQTNISISESQHPIEFCTDTTGTELKNRVGVEAIVGRNTTGEDKDQGNKREQEGAEGKSRDVDGSEYSFQQSFMDEPPIAFNDSWGLDACIEENPGCFSLRLEDSGESRQQEQSLGQGGTTKSSSSTSCLPPPSSCCVQSSKSCGSMVESTQPPTSVQAHTGPSLTPSPPDPTTRTTPQINNSLLQSDMWDSWEEEEEEDALPLSQRVNPHAQLKTPASSLHKKRRSLVPITPMPHYSDMDTPELKNKLNRFGVRPLPKRQMILKLKEIHQYTHQLVNSDSEDEAPSVGRTAQTMPHATSSAAAGNRPLSCTQRVRFKEPRVPAAISPVKHSQDEEEEPLSASQGSNTSSTAASEESERSNPELCLSSSGDSDSDGGFSVSQAANRLQDRLQAVRSFILSNSDLYGQILQYQPLVLSQLQERLKAAGIRLGAAKLVDYLDSQCVTFTTAKPGQSAPSHRRGKRTGRGAKTLGESGVTRKKGATAII